MKTTKKQTFIGRKKELNLLNEIYALTPATFIVIRGRRRIGKSTLIKEFAQGRRLLEFVGLAPDKGITAQTQREEFARKLGELFGIPGLAATDWGDLFTVLGNQVKSGNLIIFLDEISWMAHDDPTFLAKLKSAWDTQFKNNNNLMLVVCGSISSWIQKNILSSTAFVGRIAHTLSLKELSLNECNKFWATHNSNISTYEKFKYLSVTGGVPLYLELMNPQQSAEQNLQRLAFTQGGILLEDFNKIFHDLFGKRSETYEKIVRILSTGDKELSEIATALDIKITGWLSETMEELIEAGFVTRDYTWNISNGKDSKLSKYRLSDNYIRFYLKYLDKLKDRINRNSESAITTDQLENWYTVLGLQFENLVLHNRQKIKELLGINPSTIITDNPFFQNKTTKQQGCQIDYMIQTKYNILYLCEIKFSKNKIGKHIIKETQEKISRINAPKSYSFRAILIHVNGVTNEVSQSQYFSRIIDFSELFS